MDNNYILGNTSNQICQTLYETYNRLTCSYAGPLNSCLSLNSGFLIQDASKNSGIFVKNDQINFYKKNISFQEVSDDVNLKFTNGVCFSNNNKNLFFLNTDGNIAFGYSGGIIQKSIENYSLNPSISLINTGNNNCYSLSFDKKDKTSIFCIYNVNNYTNFLSTGYSFNLNNGSGLCLNSSGFFVNSCSTFNDQLQISGLTCFKQTSITTGLDVDTQSIFRKKATFCDIQLPVGFQLTLPQTLSYKTGYVETISGSCCLIFNKSTLNCLLVCSIDSLDQATFCTQASFKCLVTADKICSTEIITSSLTGNNIYANNLSATGTLNISSTGNQFICGNFLCLKATGANNNLLINAKTNFLCDINVNGTGCFQALYISDPNFSLSVGSSIGVQNMTSCSYISGNNFCATGVSYIKCLNVVENINSCGNSLFCNNCFLISGSDLSSGVCLCCMNLCTSSNIIIGNSTNYSAKICCNGYSCFCTKVETPYINSINTAKAWGVFSFVNGDVAIYSGFNLCSVSCCNATGIYAIKLKYPISAPFSLSVQIGLQDPFPLPITCREPYTTIIINSGSVGYLDTDSYEKILSTVTHGPAGMNPTRCYYRLLFGLVNSDINATAFTGSYKSHVSGFGSFMIHGCGIGI